MKSTETKNHTTPSRQAESVFGNTGGKHFFGEDHGRESFFGNSGFFKGRLQTKLTIGKPDDPFEREADSMADRVLRNIRGGIAKDHTQGGETQVQTKCEACEQEEKLQPKVETLKPGVFPVQRKAIFESNEEPAASGLEIQRKCTACAEEEKVQKKEDPGHPSATPARIENALGSAKGRGDVIPSSVRSRMEGVFGSDFTDVRIHKDDAAVQMSQDLHAQAFTHGSDIYFNRGKYDTVSDGGVHLLAHELTHVIQQGHSAMIRRQVGTAPGVKEHGDLSQIPPGVRSDCQIASTSPAGEQEVPYSQNSSRLTPATTAILNDFAGEWHRRGGNAHVRIDGYASMEGAESLNWRLSCARSLTVKNGLMHPSDGTSGIPESFIEIHAHGETNRFDQASLAPNRLASITSTIPVNPNPPSPPVPPPTPAQPPSPPAPEEKVCGPDVSAEAARIWRQIQSDFNSWGFGEKESACRYLIQPVVPSPDTGEWGLNIDAFDTLGLFLNTAGWTQQSPYHPPCGVPGSLGDPCDNRDPLHEDPDRCSNTVQIGSGCWLTGTANYGTYGVMMKLCYDWVNSPLARLLLPLAIQQALSQAFSYSTMVGLITAYKVFDQENPTWPLAWSSATYLGGPSSSPPGGNRTECQATCPVSFSAPAFDYVWEPSKPRSSTNMAPYGYPCGSSTP